MGKAEAHVASLASTVVTRFAEELRRRFGDAVRDVRLFGSFARGEAHEDSDVDVAVVLERARTYVESDIVSP